MKKCYTIIELDGVKFKQKVEESNLDIPFDKILDGVLSSLAESLSKDIGEVLFFGSYSDKILLIGDNIKEPEELASYASSLFVLLFDTIIEQYELMEPLIEEGIGIKLHDRIESLKRFKTAAPYFKIIWKDSTYNEREIEKEIVEFKTRAIKYFISKVVPGKYENDLSYLEALDNLDSDSEIFLADSSFKFGNFDGLDANLEDDLYVDLKDKLTTEKE